MKSTAEYRVEKGFIQQEIAELMDLGLSTYQQKEQGKISWMLRDLIKIRRILDVKIEDLKEVSELEPEPKLFKKDFLVLLDDYEESLIDNQASDSTIRQYVGNARMFIDRFTDDEKPLDKRVMRKFEKGVLNSDYKPKTLSNKITTVNRFLYYCEQGSKAIKNIVIQEENVIEHRLKESEFKRLYTHAKAIGDMNMHWLIKIMGRLGIRFEELKFVTAE